jgi:hypothetical protein
MPIGDSWFIRKGSPPDDLSGKDRTARPPMTDEKQIKLTRESIADEDRWVKNFIDRLTGVFRDEALIPIRY